MTVVYHHFIGIDIGKFNLVVSSYGSKDTQEYTNDKVGIDSFLKDHTKPDALYILETTGGHEMNLLHTLLRQNLSAHRANTRKVKNFIRSLGNDVKTDKLDAKALALYGFERSDRLSLFVPQTSRAFELSQLTERRYDLRQMLVAEKNRTKAPTAEFIKSSCNTMIEAIAKELESITNSINAIIESDAILTKKKEVLKTIPGIGEIISNDLIAMMPELGSVNRRQIASLGGVAPRANESGKFVGYRSTGHGRSTIKPALFIAAMAARNSKSELKDFYEKLISKGKKKMVALVALMRKIIVIANAKLRDLSLATRREERAVA
jgi:transposase